MLKSSPETSFLATETPHESRLPHLVSLLQEPSNIPLRQATPQVVKCRDSRLAAASAATGARADGARRGCIAQLAAQLLHEHARVAAQRQPAHKRINVNKCAKAALAHLRLAESKADPEMGT